MPKSRIILCLGFFLALLPVLGFPNSWDHFFDTALGLLIVLLSVLISVDRRLMLKAKAEKRTQRKRVIATSPSEPVAEIVPVPEPEPAPEPAFFHREPVIEHVPEPVFEPASQIEIVESVVPEPEPASMPRPKRKRRVKVLDADASASDIPAAPETFDTSGTGF